MTRAHRDAQEIFRDLGDALGYMPRNSFSSAFPTDGVWLSRTALQGPSPLPLVAIEVVVSESRKTVRGSVLTLELVSPALGIVLVHEDELRRRHIRSGGTSSEADHRLQGIRRHALDLAAASRQRIEVWSFAALKHHWRGVTGAESIYQLRPQRAARAA